ncbi:hypothetical protein DIPPA_14875 [Diplonema papillatum]|nr:hypothetical protein DIPPA_14875 [Diplonema papillatum]
MTRALEGEDELLQGCSEEVVGRFADLTERMKRKDDRIRELLTELERGKQKDMRSQGEIAGLKVGLEEAHERLSQEIESSQRRVAKLENRIQEMNKQPKLAGTVRDLQLALEKKNAEIRNLVENNRSVVDCGETVALKQLLEQSTQDLQTTRLHLLKYNRLYHASEKKITLLEQRIRSQSGDA